MTDSLKSLIASGTRLWLDSVDLDLVVENHRRGATGATSNPLIIADLIKSGRCDQQLSQLANRQADDENIAWRLTDQLVRQAQEVFHGIWVETQGNDGYVSFELDPLLEDPQLGPPHQQRVAAYVKSGQRWAEGHDNRMIKVPATPAGLAAVEELAASGVVLNVTLIFATPQYRAARDAIWRGAQRSGNPAALKSVYSIFVSRLDVYTDQHVPELAETAQGQVGIVNAKRIWQENTEFWQDKDLPLDQEIVFASTGTKKPEDPPWKYVAAFAGSGIQTNPPVTNQAVLDSGLEFTSQVANLPDPDVLQAIDEQVDFEKLEQVLLAEGIQKFAEPQKALLELIAAKRKALCGEAV